MRDQHDALGNTSRNNLAEIARFLERLAAQDEADFERTRDEQKRADALEKRERLATIHALLEMRGTP